MVGQSNVGHTFLLTIIRRYPIKGICVLEFFGGICIGLTTLLQVGVRVQLCLYVEKDEATRKIVCTILLENTNNTQS